MYYRVYAPSGEPFDVPRDRADNLILQHGWTQKPITIVEEIIVNTIKKPLLKPSTNTDDGKDA